MAMSFTTLTADKTTAGSIKRWVNYAELDVEQVLEEAQALIYQTLRVREMKSDFTDLTLAAGEYYKALPDGWLDPIALQDKTNNVPFGLTLEENIEANRFYESGSLIRGMPQWYGIYGEKFQFELAAESETIIGVVGYKKPALLAGGNLTNFLTNRYPHLLRTACLVQAADFMSNDAKYQRHLSMLSALIEKTNAESDLSYRGVQLEVSVG